MRRRFSMSTHPVRSLWSASRSKSWPGCSRFAIGVLIFCLLIAIAQLVVSSLLDVNILNVEPNFQCLAKGGKFVDPLPTTFFSKGPSKAAPWIYFSILEHDKKAEMVICGIVSSCLILFFLQMLIVMHFRRISNRMAMAYSIGVIVLFILLSTQGIWLNIDTHEVDSEHKWCWISRHEMKKRLVDRTKRRGLIIADEVLSTLGAFSMCTYFALALTATVLNNTRLRLEATELHSFPADSSSPPSSSTNANSDATLVHEVAPLPESAAPLAESDAQVHDAQIGLVYPRSVVISRSGTGKKAKGSPPVLPEPAVVTNPFGDSMELENALENVGREKPDNRSREKCNASI